MSGSDRVLSITMRVEGVLPCPDDAPWLCCLNCGAPLELHQPDGEEPRRFVGTCGACDRWYLLDWDPGAAGGLVLLLPGPEELRAAPRGDGGRPDAVPGGPDDEPTG
jgi:hypothetical protein